MNATRRDASAPELSGVLGILGGMGPLATAYFYQRVVEQTAGTTDQEHLPVVVWGDPTIPDRSAALIDPSAPDPTPWLLRGLHALHRLGADLIAVPCNSAHPFLAELDTKAQVPILDIVAATVDHATEMLGPGGRVAVLSTEGTYRAGMYHRMLRAAGLEVVRLTPPTQRRVQLAITEIKAGRPDVARTLGPEVERSLRAAAPDAVIAGCTELTTIRDGFVSQWPVIDSATVLASSAVGQLRGRPAAQPSGSSRSPASTPQHSNLPTRDVRPAATAATAHRGLPPVKDRP